MTLVSRIDYAPRIIDAIFDSREIAFKLPIVASIEDFFKLNTRTQAYLDQVPPHDNRLLRRTFHL